MAGPSSSESPSRPTFASWDYAATAVLASALFTYLATARMVDDDEGYYALAGRAIAEGHVPYVDFFFPQLPLSAALYAGVRAVLGPGLGPLRAAAAALAVGTALLVHHAARREAGPLAGCSAAALFCSHTLVWEWAPVVKTFPPALFLGTAALMVATTRSSSARGAALAGGLAGLAVSSRLLSIAVAVGVAFAFLRNPERRRLAPLALVGFLVALVPVALLAMIDGRAFLFDNLLFHTLRSPGLGLVKHGFQKIDVLREVFLTPLGAHRPDATGLQTTFLFGCVLWFSRRPTFPAALAPWVVTAVTAAALSLLPSPAWTQYFVAAVVPASVVVGTWAARAFSRPSRALLPTLLHALSAAPAFRDRVVDADPAFRPAAVDAVGQELDRVTPPGLAVAAHLPAYLVASRRPVLPAAESQFARLYTERVPEELRVHLHLYTEADFRDELLSPAAGTFVVGPFVVPETALALRDHGYRQVSALSSVTLWARGAP